MNKIAVIGVPSSIGARRIGQENAPKSFRLAGLIDRLRALDLYVVDHGDLPQIAYSPDPGHPMGQNLALVASVVRQVAREVRAAVLDGVKLIVLGGDCTIALGVLAGLVDSCPNIGLLYFDGDLDLNTPETTSSGIFDGMGMAHMLGEGAPELAHIGPRYPLISEDKVVLFGYNPETGWIDPAEFTRLERSSMIRYPVSQLHGRTEETAAEAFHRLQQRAEHILVHFDVDVIDSTDFPASDVIHPGGLSFDEAMTALRVFVAAPHFAGLVVTEFNPNNDLARISDLKLRDKGVEDMRCLCSCVNRARGSLPEVDTQWVRAKISPFNSPSTGFCASIFKDRG